MSLVINGTYTAGIILSGSSNNPATVTSGSTIATSGRYAIYGSAGYRWTLANNGVLSGGSYGVTLASGGTVTNTAAGQIGGGLAGVVIAGATGSVGNTGTIAGTQSIGVWLGAGGIVSNGSAQAAAATVTGYYAGIEVSGGAGSVSNAGTVQATGSYAVGVLLQAGGTVANLAGASSAGHVRGTTGVLIAGAGVVSNYGTITSTGGYGYYGVQITGVAALTNGGHKSASGLITGGVQLASGSIGNYGTIDATAGGRRAIYATSLYGTLSVTNSGTITGAEGIRAAGALRVVNGSGNPLALIKGRDFGIYAESGGAVINNGSIQSDFGVLMFGAGSQSLRVVNGTKGATTGQITGVSAGVYMRFYGAATNVGQVGLTNYGTIRGTSAGVVMAAESGGMTLINPGTISASVGKGGVAVEFMGGASAVLAVSVGSSFGGNVVAYSTGGNILDFTSAATGGTISGIGTKFQGFQNVWLDPLAQWTITGGNTLAAGSGITLHGQSTLTLGGALSVGGSMNIAAIGTVVVASTGRLEVGTAGHAGPGVITVDPGFTMAGWGVVQGNIVNNGAVEANAGTLDLRGTLSGGIAEITASSVLRAEVVGFAPGQVQFLSGQATLQLAAGVDPTASMVHFGAYAGNGIELLGTSASVLNYTTLSSSSGVLNLATTGGGNFSLVFASGSYTASQFHTAKVLGGTATLITFH